MKNMSTNSIVIDFKILDSLNLTVRDYLNLVYLYKYNRLLADKENLDNLINNKYIKLNTDSKEIELRETAVSLIEFLSIQSFNKYNDTKIIKKSKKQVTAEVTERIENFRNKWKGLKAGSMGGKKDCISKLIRWMLENPEYSFDEILSAAQLYLDTEGRDIRFLQRADYFIYKQDVHKGEASRLSAFIDEINTTQSDDWTSQLV